MFNSQRGVSILFALLILTVVLAVALGTSTIVIRQLKTMRVVGQSVVAFYAADHGIEEVLLMDVPYSISETELANEATYEVTVNASTSSSCDADNYCIKSVGGYKDKKRAIEITY